MPEPSGQLTLQLRIELDERTPTVWRRIFVPTSIRVAKLHDIFQAAMGWTNSHLHAFTMDDRRIGMCFEDHPEGEIDEYTVSVLAVLRGQTSFAYEYDFGDSWRHTVTVERELRALYALKYAICLDGANACPPEDSGGPGGLEHMLEALADPDHQEYVTWTGGRTFDRSAFNIVETNARLQKVRQRTSRISHH